MAVDMFLKLEGCPGESTDDKHKGEIDVLSWSWGMSQSGTTHTSQGGGAGKVNVSDLTVLKYVDKSSHVLQKNCTTGEHIPSGNLVIRKAGKVPLEYVKIAFKDLIVTSINQSGTAGSDERFTETITLNFAEYKFEYSAQKADGSGEAAVTWGYNMAKNTKV